MATHPNAVQRADQQAAEQNKTANPPLFVMAANNKSLPTAVVGANPN